MKIDLNMTGMVVAMIGIGCLVICLFLGIYIGSNEETIVRYYTLEEPTSTDTHIMQDAVETNAFMVDFSRGLATIGMGLVMIGAGFTIIKKHKKSYIVLLIGSAAFFILLISLILSIYMGAITMEAAEIQHKERPQEYDGYRLEEIAESQAFVRPVNWYLGEFSMGSFGIAVALFTIVVAAYYAKIGAKKQIMQTIMQQSPPTSGSTQTSSVETQVVTPPPPTAYQDTYAKPKQDEKLEYF